MNSFQKRLNERLKDKDFSNAWFNLEVEYKKEIERLQKGIKVIMEHTNDDDTHEFLDRLLKGKENDAPEYRIKVDKDKDY